MTPPAPTPPAPTAQAAPDADWAARWKAAAAVKAARDIAAQREAEKAKTLAQTMPYPDVAPRARFKTVAKSSTSQATANAKPAQNVPAQNIDANAEWAARWKAAAEARRVTQPAVAPARQSKPAGHPAEPEVPSKPPVLATIAVVATPAEPPQHIKTQHLLTLAQRRRPGRPSAAEAATPAEAAPTGGDAAALAETAAADAAGTTLPSDPAMVEPVEEDLVPIDDFTPFGYADSPFQESANDKFGGRNRRVPQSDFLPLPDRFRIGLPGDYVQNVRGSLYDPYDQNILKGDYPIIDKPGEHDDLFLIMTLTSDTLVEARRLPIPTSVSAKNSGQFEFFEDAGEMQVINQNFVATVEFFEGDTVYKPRDFEIRATVVGNINYVHAEQQQVVNIDFREGTDRYDEELAVQELFYEKHLMDLSNSYDVLALRAGIQGFNSDFRGFLFSDNLPGIRLFGNYDNNRWQYNLAYFRQVEKDTNSGLNTFNDRDQNIIVANVYRQDFIWPGYTAQLSFHYNNDHSSDEVEYDKNGFIVRPLPAGTIEDDEIDVVYLGWAGDGHIGRLNLSHQVYQALGRESHNNIAGQEVDINAQFAAVELSYDVDYIRYRGSFVYASGDEDPDDGTGDGFDGIFDNPNIAGGGINYFIRQPVRLTGSGVGLKQRLSLYNNLRTSKEQGQANFVNPGLLLFNLGADIEVTPKVKVIANASYLRFAQSDSMELLLQDNMIDEEIGVDLSVGVIYRPFLNNNVIFTGGAACLLPGQGFKDLYTSETLYSFFTAMTFTY